MRGADRVDAAAHAAVALVTSTLKCNIDPRRLCLLPTNKKSDLMQQFLAATDVIDWHHPAVLAQARASTAGAAGAEEVAKRCFEWVRDAIKHSRDYQLQAVTCAASEVLQVGSGYCYAKSHLLAALLRANGIPAGFCYQRLSRDDNGPPFCLHGLNAVFLPGVGWYRIDARGNRADIDAQFVPPVEQLAFPLRIAGEADLQGVWADPLPVVVSALRANATADALWANLPDLDPAAALAADAAEPLR
jgi:transglutaminase-like putative cysteine protease